MLVHKRYVPIVTLCSHVSHDLCKLLQRAPSLEDKRGYTMRIFFSIAILFLLEQNAFSSSSMQVVFEGLIETIPQPVASAMIGVSWNQLCPVALEQLRSITVSYWGYDDLIHRGHMIVHVSIAQEMVDIFSELFDARFPIERMELIDVFNADDESSMSANNSSAFCCRQNTTLPGIFSHHAYGLAIDINPLVNPYVKGDRVCPTAGKKYCDRTCLSKGGISQESSCYKAFTARGFLWGGNAWSDRKDYQHFFKEISEGAVCIE